MAPISKYIDHTLLKLDATQEQIDQLCDEARAYNFKSVCVRLPWVARCVQNLQDSNVLVACTIGFHEGTHLTAEKVKEAQDAVAAGAKELDMVLNYPKLLAGDQVSPLEDVKAVRAAAPAPTVLKVIVETAQLDWSALKQACDIVLEAKADFIKTSTGFNGAGAQVDDVRFMREQMGANASVKASGGIRSLADCQKMIDAGADRIGASAGVAIMKEAKGENEGIAGGDGY
ncbi:MAG: hypothetical protein MMC23_004034 [Stictis urceolatum]|nr:hypothetical protein [Stictis urceolata]